MGLGGVLSRCKGVFGNMSKGAPGPVRAAASKPTVKTGYQAKVRRFMTTAGQ